MFGLVLDLSYRQDGDGKRIIDAVKSELAQFATDTLEGEDLFYLYHPEVWEPVEGVGSAVSVISNYETDGWLINVDYAIRQTFYVVEAEDEDLEQMVLFVTDRVQDKAPFRKLLLVLRKQEMNCKFVLIGVGSHYKKNVLEEVAENDNFSYIHLDSPSELQGVLLNSRS